MPPLTKLCLTVSTREAPCSSQGSFADAGDKCRTWPELSKGQAAPLCCWEFTRKNTPACTACHELFLLGQVLQRSCRAAHCLAPRSTAQPRMSQELLNLGAKAPACLTTRKSKCSQAPYCQEFHLGSCDTAVGLVPSSHCHCNQSPGTIFLLQLNGALLVPKYPTQVQKKPPPCHIKESWIAL